MAKSTTFLLPGRVATCTAYWSGTNTCSSRLASCASPKMPRVLTLVSRCLRSPTPWASVCISPRPLCTCSSRSATCLKLSPRRACSVVCSFSSTVARISSSLAALVVCSCASCWFSASRTAVMPRALVSLISARRRAVDSPTLESWVCKRVGQGFLHQGQLLAKGVDLRVLRARGFRALLRQGLLEGGQVLAQVLARALDDSAISRRSSRSSRSWPVCNWARRSCRALYCCAASTALMRIAGQPDSHPGQQTKGHYAERQQRPYQSIIHVASVLTATVI
jgi:hypothetical protein